MRVCWGYLSVQTEMNAHNKNRATVFIGELFASRGHLTMSGDIFSCHISGRACYWQLVGRDQRCC
jgi:hypothetical protein